MATIIYGELRTNVAYATAAGATVTIHRDDPLPDHVTIAMSDTAGKRVVMIPQALFDGAIAAYLDAQEPKEDAPS